MVNLLLLGGPDHGAFSSALRAVLSGCVCTENAGLPGTKDAEFSLCEEAAASSGRCLVLCKPNFTEPEPPALFDVGTVGVLQSGNAAAARALARAQIPVVSCGMAVTDTLTFSSLSGECAVICVQRTIPTLSGIPVEPGELPLALSRRYSEYPLMCAVASLLILGGWEKLSRFSF